MADYESENLRSLPLANPEADPRSVPLGSNEGSLGASPAMAGSQGMPSAQTPRSAADLYAEKMMGLQGTWRGALYGFGMGLAGRDPQAAIRDAMTMQQRQQQIGMQGQELDLHRQKFAEETRQFLVTKQLAVGTLVHQFLGEISKYPASQRSGVAQSVKGFLGPMMKELGMPVPDTVLDALINQPGAADAYTGLLSTYFGKDPERIKQINAALEGMKPEQVMPAIKTMLDLDAQQAKPGVMRALEQYTREVLPKLSVTDKQRVGLLDEKGKHKPIAAGTLLSVFDSVYQSIHGKPPSFAEQRAASEVLGDKDLEGWRAGIGVAVGSASIKAAETTATTQAKEGTETGRLEAAKTRAETLKAGFGTVPGQGGALIRLPGAGPVPGGAAPSGPVAQAGEGGLTLAPGAQVVAQSPGPGLSPEAAKGVSNLGESLARLEQLVALTKTGKADQYMGPKMSRPWSKFKEWAVTSLPSAIVGNVPDTLSDLEQAGAIVKNIQILTRTGAAVRESEEPRLLKEMPDRERDKPEMFKRKLGQSLANARVLVKRYTELVGPDGRLKAGADPAAVAKRLPLPKPSGGDDDPLGIR